MRDMIVRMKARNRAKAVSTRRYARDTNSCGTNAAASSAAPRTSRSTVRAYTNEATNTPSVHWVMRVDRKSCRIRGLNWLLASCMTTMVMEKTRPVTEIIALATVPSTLRAPAGPPGKATPIWWWRAASSRGRMKPSDTAAGVARAGITQKGSKRRRSGEARCTAWGSRTTGTRATARFMGASQPAAAPPWVDVPHGVPAGTCGDGRLEG